MEETRKRIRLWARATSLYCRAFGRWFVLASVIGGVCGLLGAVFHIALEAVTELRAEQSWLLYALPLAGLAVVALYHLLRVEGQGTNDVFIEVYQGGDISIRLVPAIFFGTILTHLCGGSAGREGAALQMGGTLGYHLGRVCRLDEKELRIATTTGMAAFFSALFGTPLAAAVFAIAVVSVDAFYHAALFPAFAAALEACGISLLMGISPTQFQVAAPVLTPGLLLRTGVLAMLCALLSTVFCETIHMTEHLMAKKLPNPWLRVLTGGCLVIVLTLLCGTGDYNGAGMNVIAAAVEEGTVRPWAFVLKLVFTAVTLGAGYKGGEVVPSFFVGAAFGCWIGPLLGLPAGFAAALGMISIFCGAVNCPLASIFLSVELFGGGGLLCFALACCISYMLSGYNGLYSGQKILHSKLKALYINVNANPEDTPEEDT